MNVPAFLAKNFPFFSTEAKTLDQAKANQSAAKLKVEAISQLFENAGLDADALVSAGPDSLKAHLASLSASDAELAAVKAKLETANAEVLAKTALASTHAATVATQAAKISELESAQSTAAKVAVEMLAKAGHVVVKESALGKNAPAASTAVLKTRAEVNAMSPGAKQKFYREGGKLSEL